MILVRWQLAGWREQAEAEEEQQTERKSSAAKTG